MKMPSKKTIRKQITELAVFVAVLLLLFYTGLGTQISSTLQKGLLWTGLADAGPVREEIGRADFNFVIRDLQNQPQNFDQWKGKVVFFNLWATWCPPCIAEMPAIAELRKSLAGEDDIVFVLLSSEKELAKVSKFIEKRQWTDLPVFLQASPLPVVFRSNVIPTTFVIAPNGDIVYKKTGIANYNHPGFRSFLKELATEK